MNQEFRNTIVAYYFDATDVLLPQDSVTLFK